MLRPQVSKHAVLHYYSSSCLHSIATHSLHCLSELMNDTKEREMFRCSLQLHLFPSAIHTPDSIASAATDTVRTRTTVWGMSQMNECRC